MCMCARCARVAKIDVIKQDISYRPTRCQVYSKTLHVETSGINSSYVYLVTAVVTYVHENRRKGVYILCEVEGSNQYYICHKTAKEQMFSLYLMACLFICLSINKIIQIVVDKMFMKCFVTRKNWLDFGGDLHSDQDPVNYFFFTYLEYVK